MTFSKKSNLNIATMAMLASTLISGCRSDEPIAPATAESDPYVTFTITLSDHHETRAGENAPSDPFPGENWENPSSTETGTEFDNRVNDLLPVLYEISKDDDRTLLSSSPVGKMTDPVYDRNSKEGTLKITGKLETSLSVEELQKGHFRLAVFVNTPELNINTPASYTFTQHGAPSEDFTGIPMYGVGEASFAGFNPENANESTPFPIKSGEEALVIPILRSMAKVRVKVKQDLFEKRQMKLHNIYLTRHCKEGFVVPTGWNTVPAVTNLGVGQAMNALKNLNLENDFEHECHISPSVEDKSTSQNSWTMLRLYLPDTYNNIHDGITNTDGTNDAEIQLWVEYFSDGNEDEKDLKRHPILFRPYKNGEADMSVEPWDLIRNHIYEFVITGIEPRTGELQITVNTEWWGEHKLSIED